MARPLFFLANAALFLKPGQSPVDTKALDRAVPAALRASFRRAFNHAVSAQVHRDWTALYALQWQVAIEHRSLEEFVSVRKDRRMGPGRVSGFGNRRERPPNSPLSAGGSWTVIGCARIKEQAKFTDNNSEIRIDLVNGTPGQRYRVRLRGWT